MVDLVQFLGPTANMAITSSRRERMKALAPQRRASAREGLAGFLDVVGTVSPTAWRLAEAVDLPR
jgi:hypothetical protein